MSDVEDRVAVWADVLELLEKSLSPYAYKNWFKDSTTLLARNDNTLEVGVPNGTYQNVIRKKFGTEVEKCCEQLFGRRMAVSYTISGKLCTQLDKVRPPAAVEPSRLAATKPDGKPHESAYVPHFHFKRRVRKISQDDLVISGFNKIAVSACQGIIRGDEDSPNPLFIYGDSGMGKTFLLQLIYNEIKRDTENPRNVVFASCESFTNDYISSLQNGSITNFRSFFRSTDVFLLDDIHFLAEGSKSSTKSEFLHTFNDLLNSNKQVVITCDKHPTTVHELGSKLVKRILGGMWVQINRPTMEMRVELLQNLTRKYNVEISQEVLNAIASEYYHDIRALTGALTTVVKYCSYSGEPCSLKMMTKALGTLPKEEKDISVGLKNIVNEVCAYFKIENADIFSERRSRTIANARHICMYLCNKYMKDVSLAELAVIFKNSRPGVLYAGNKITRAVKDKDRMIAPAVKQISDRIESRYL